VNSDLFLFLKSFIVVRCQPYFTIRGIYDALSISVSTCIIYICFIILFTRGQFLFPVAEFVAADSFARKDIAKVSFRSNPAFCTCFILCQIISRQTAVSLHITDHPAGFCECINIFVGGILILPLFSLVIHSTIFTFRIIFYVVHYEICGKQSDNENKEEFEIIFAHEYWLTEF